YGPSLAQPDIRTLGEKITSNRESARKEYKTDAERRVGQARDAGEKYIRDATTISSSLLAFDQVAKQVQADQAYRFNTETIGLDDVGKINDLARQRTTEA